MGMDGDLPAGLLAGPHCIYVYQVAVVVHDVAQVLAAD